MNIRKIKARWHTNNTAYSAAVSNIQNTIGLRVQVHEPITDKFYYFIFPVFSYTTISSIEIPFSKDGLPSRQTSNWWSYEVTSSEVSTAPMFENQKEYVDYKMKTKTTLNKFYDFDYEETEEIDVETSIVPPLTKDHTVIIKVPKNDLKKYTEALRKQQLTGFEPATVLVLPKDIDIEIIKQ